MRQTIVAYFTFLVLGLFPAVLFASSFSVQELSVFEINSAITPATFDYLESQFKRAPKDSLLLVKMNTPGGLISTTKDIITLMGKQDRPIVVWVTPEGASAASAGAIIASAAHFIVMTSGTSMGAATPVGLGEDIKESDGRSKAMSDLKALVRSLSHSRQRPAGPFEEMIESAKSFTDREALKAGISNGSVSSEGDLAGVLSGKNFTIRGSTFQLQLDRQVRTKLYEPTSGQQLLNVLSNPSTAYFLFLLGVALLYFELQAPGGYIAGGIGASLLVLSAISFQVLPLDWGALALLLVGAILLVLEIYVTSYGLLGISGLVSFIAGSLFLFHGEGGFISIDYPVLVSTLLGVFSASALIVWLLWKEKKKQGHDPQFFLPHGSRGTVLTQTAPDHFQIKVLGEIWNARGSSDLRPGDQIQVSSVDTEKLLANITKVSKE